MKEQDHGTDKVEPQKFESQQDDLSELQVNEDENGNTTGEVYAGDGVYL